METIDIHIAGIVCTTCCLGFCVGLNSCCQDDSKDEYFKTKHYNQDIGGVHISKKTNKVVCCNCYKKDLYEVSENIKRLVSYYEDKTERFRVLDMREIRISNNKAIYKYRELPRNITAEADKQIDICEIEKVDCDCGYCNKKFKGIKGDIKCYECGKK